MSSMKSRWPVYGLRVHTPQKPHRKGPEQGWTRR
jgi:hypothetical protein